MTRATADPRARPEQADVYVAEATANWVEGEHTNTRATLNVPAGSYLINAKGFFANLDDDPQEGMCNVSTGDHGLAGLGRVLDHHRETVALLDAATFDAPATITLDCSLFNGVIQSIVTATEVTTIR